MALSYDWEIVLTFIENAGTYKKPDVYTSEQLRKLIEIHPDMPKAKDLAWLAYSMTYITSSMSGSTELERMIWYWLSLCARTKVIDVTGADPYEGAGALRKIRDVAEERAYTARSATKKFQLTKLFELASILYERARSRGYSLSNPHR